MGSELLGLMKSRGFTAPTPIQAQAWPIALNNHDLVAVAKTGSGKTLAFLLPALHAISQKKTSSAAGPAVLVLAPTRELTMQISEEAVGFGAVVGVQTEVVFGGVPKPPQVKALRKKQCLVLVATPGRLVDLCNDGAAELGGVSVLVLDEADRMLDMGFEDQMKVVMKLVSPQRQTLLFSATWPKAVQKLAGTYLKQGFVHLNIGETDELAANKAVSQKFFRLDDSQKERQLWMIWDELVPTDKMIVFANTKRRIDNLQRTVWGLSLIHI
eukprot:TRINITY_DN33259_c0_g1_i1.p1 TRINITY_DN33259_c0_g1~~TRINITY_DN33259_c0_g1_i1.p1  ORF type:complete len:270 (-),score=98.58 TRINITY_DN33259_c0_g1_i1:113-922(-)